MSLQKDMVTYLKVTEECAKQAIRAYKRAKNEYMANYGGHESHAVDEGLRAAEAILKEGGFRSYGTDGICGQSFCDGEYRNPPSMYDSIVSYLNSGDIYHSTLMAVGNSFRLRVGCVGDVIESCDRRYGRIYEQ